MLLQFQSLGLTMCAECTSPKDRPDRERVGLASSKVRECDLHRQGEGTDLANFGPRGDGGSLRRDTVTDPRKQFVCLDVVLLVKVLLR